MKKFAKMAVAAAIAGFGMAANAAAVVVVDTFQVDQTFLKVGDVGTFDTNSQDGLGILGGNRDLFLFKEGNPGSTTDSQFGVEGSLLSYSESSTGYGYGVARWDGSSSNIGFNATDANGIADGAFGLTEDWSSKTSIQISVDSSDGNFPFTVAIFTDANNWTALTIRATATNSPYTFPIELADFLGGSTPFLDANNPATLDLYSRTAVGTLNLGNVTQVMAFIGAGFIADNVGDPTSFGWNKVTKKDADLEEIRVVPEPESLALVGLGLLGLAASRRRKASK